MTKRFRAIQLWPYLLLLPFFVVFLLFFVGPVLLAAYQSVFRDRMIGGRVFVGAQNYAQVLADDKFWDGVWRIGQFGVIFTPLTIVLALLFALVLDRGAVRWAGLFRLVFFLPYAIPGVVATMMWGFLYGPSFGPLNQMLHAVGLAGIDFLSARNMLYSLGNIDVWLYVGYDMIVFFAALQAIPRDLYEAAQLDGATALQVALRIKIPLIAPVISVVMIFSIIGTLQLFTEPAVMAPLAPEVIGNDYVPNYYAFSLASTGQQFNYVAAISFVLAGIVLAVSAVYFLVMRRLGRSA